jgi:hypothetical protein
MVLKLATVVNVSAGETCDVLCDRSTKWGNPYSHLPSSRARFKVKTREEAIKLYPAWFWKQQHLIDALCELRGKRLGCHCKPKACHCDFLVDIANQTMIQLL